MRQFMLGLLVAALVWWGWTSWQRPADAAGPAIRPPALEEVYATGVQPRDGGAAPGGAGASPGVGAAAGTGRGVALEAGGIAANGGGAQQPVDIERLIAGLRPGDPASITAAWQALRSPHLAAAHRRQLCDLLRPRGEDFEALCAALGTTNGCLHSSFGREVLAAAVQSAGRLEDELALAALTRVLELCMRGPIERDQAEARAAVDHAYQQHRLRVDRWLCNPANVAGARSHVVARGDTLGKIAARFRREGILVDDGTLAILNRIHNPKALQVGQRIKVPIEPIHAVVEKRSFLMAVYVGGTILRLYWVGHGAADKTPVAEFKVGEKLDRPDWYSPDGSRYPYGHPANILGDYFLKFEHASHAGFGAHGTPMPETIGTMSSMGCIRMLADDIAELFRLLPRGATVSVRDSA